MGRQMVQASCAFRVGERVSRVATGRVGTPKGGGPLARDAYSFTDEQVETNTLC